MDEVNMSGVVNILGGIADHLVFQMAFTYHLKHNTSFIDALKYTLDKLEETQNYIPEWVEGRNKDNISV